MQPHQQRVVDEKTELDGKLDRLKLFISGTVFPSLEPAEQLRLVRQARIMEEYSSILDERIANFKPEPKTASAVNWGGVNMSTKKEN